VVPARRERRDLLASSIQSTSEAITSQVRDPRGARTQVRNPPQFVWNEEEMFFVAFCFQSRALCTFSVANVRVVPER
jgi:hypothetical protein